MIRATLTLLAGGTRLEVLVALSGDRTTADVAHAALHFEGLQGEALRGAYGFAVPSLPSLHYALRESHHRWQASFDVPACWATHALDVAARAGTACGLDVTLVGLANVATAPPGRPGPLKSTPPPAVDRRVG